MTPASPPKTFSPRLLRLLLLVVAAGVPAAALRVLCAGNSCNQPATASATVPFCSLGSETRRLVAAGFRDGRSPEVLAVTGEGSVVDASPGGGARYGPVWPTATSADDAVPLVFWGTGVDPSAQLPPSTSLDAVAPTVAEITGLRRPHPEVRSGRALPGVASGQIPRLVLEVVAVGAGAGELRAPWLRRLARRGVGGFDARPGSLPLEPAAVLTTIGTGGLPRQHGIVGARVRNDEGKLVDSWGRGSPLSVIATLGDDLDEVLRQRPKIGLVAGNRSERGLIGGTWYVGTDRDDVSVGGGPVKRARAGLSKGYGRDPVPDLLGVTISQGPDRFDRSLRRLVEAGTAASGGSLAVVVTATGSFHRGVPAARVARVVERRAGRGVIEAATASGLFTDQKVLARRGISEDDVAAALERVRGRGGRPLTVDQFPAIAVAFARYC